jgi:hypothetical protein
LNLRDDSDGAAIGDCSVCFSSSALAAFYRALIVVCSLRRLVESAIGSAAQKCVKVMAE